MEIHGNIKEAIPSQLKSKFAKSIRDQILKICLTLEPNDYFDYQKLINKYFYLKLRLNL